MGYTKKLESLMNFGRFSWDVIFGLAALGNLVGLLAYAYDRSDGQHLFYRVVVGNTHHSVSTHARRSRPKTTVRFLTFLCARVRVQAVVYNAAHVLVIAWAPLVTYYITAATGRLLFWDVDKNGRDFLKWVAYTATECIIIWVLATSIAMNDVYTVAGLVTTHILGGAANYSLEVFNTSPAIQNKMLKYFAVSLRFCVGLAEWGIILTAYIFLRKYEGDTDIYWVEAGGADAVVPLFVVYTMQPLSKIYFAMKPRDNHWPVAQTDAMLSLMVLTYASWNIMISGLCHKTALPYT